VRRPHRPLEVLRENRTVMLHESTRTGLFVGKLYRGWDKMVTMVDGKILLVSSSSALRGRGLCDQSQRKE